MSSLFSSNFCVLIIPRTDLGLSLPCVDLRFHNFVLNGLFIFNIIQLQFFLEYFAYVIDQRSIILVPFSFEVIRYFLYVPRIVLLAESFEVEASTVLFELELVATAMETAHNLARRLFIKVHLKVAVLRLAADDSLISGGYSLFAAV